MCRYPEALHIILLC